MTEFDVLDPVDLRPQTEMIERLLKDPNEMVDGQSILWDCFIWDQTEPGEAYWFEVSTRLEHGGSLTDKERQFIGGMLWL